jgi:hypothetical protein
LIAVFGATGRLSGSVVRVLLFGTPASNKIQ